MGSWQKRKFFLQSLFFLLTVIFLATPHLAKAFTVSPPLVEIEIEKGDSLIQKITLYNEANQVVAIYPSIENFNPAQIGKKTTEEIAAHNPSSWIKSTEERIVLQPSAQKDVFLNIKVDDLAEPGGYYVAVFWSDHPNGDGISAANRLATLFFFKIKGTVKESLAVAGFKQEKNLNNARAFNLILENQGNVHLQPSGQLRILNWRHQQVALIPVNFLKQYILPQSNKNFEVVLDKTSELPWGWYYANAKVIYGSNNQELFVPEIKFWVLPAQWLSWFSGSIIFVVLLVIAWQLAQAKKRRQYEN